MEVSSVFMVEILFILFISRIIKRIIMVKIYSLFSLVLLFLLPACSPQTSVHEITDTRIVQPEERVMPPKLTTAERFGITDTSSPSDKTRPSSGTQALDASVTGDSTTVTSRIKWVPPVSWTQGEARPMRLATFFTNTQKDAECTVSVLAGKAGGVIPNLNRWRTQMGLAPLTEEETGQLASFDLLDSQATYMECVNTPSTADGQPADERMLLGVICPLGNETIFIKMTGPPASITVEKDNFMAFVKSFHFEGNPLP